MIQRMVTTRRIGTGNDSSGLRAAYPRHAMPTTSSSDPSTGGAEPAMRPPGKGRGGHGLLRRWLLALVAFLALIVLVVVFFPWDLLRGPINRYVSEKTGRRFEITRRLDVKLGRTATVVLDGIEFANPSWARDPYLIRAEGAEVEVRLWPLLRREVVLPSVKLRSPEVGLQMEPDGRKTWAFDQHSSNDSSTPDVGRLQVDNGKLHFVDSGKGADIRVDIQLQEQGDNRLPLRYDAKGTWQKQPFSASGRTGGVLQLTDLAEAPPFPLEIDATAGQTRFVAKGTIGSLATMENISADVQLRGRSLSDLYGYLGVVLPTTPPYTVRAHVDQRAGLWKVTGLQGELGSSDLSGELQYDQRQKVAKLSGNLVSERLDFNDLGPIVGLEPAVAKVGDRPTAAGAVSQPAASRTAEARKARRAGKVLPATKLDFARLSAMDADVRFDAKRIQHVEQLPLQSLRTHVLLEKGTLRLDPLDMTVAGGKVDGTLRIDSGRTPAGIAIDVKGRRMQLNQLFPSIERTKSSLGELTAQVKLQGQGGSVAQLLGDVSGEVGVLTGSGRFSNMLMEFIGLDGGEVIRFFVSGDREVRLRCAAAAFDVKKGVMTSKTIVFDTSDTVVYGDGRIDLGDETLALVLRPQPKDVSILSFRSPLNIGGTFGDPSAFPDKGALAGRAAAAVALGLINPLLALAATVETGPGQNADCGQALRQTPAPKPAAK
jgi:uncharacterized protein involved in outer membrane biogenesis